MVSAAGVPASIHIAAEDAVVLGVVRVEHPVPVGVHGIPCLEDDPEEADGLRLDVTDPGPPIPTGVAGVRAFGVAARFDDPVVLPIDVLPEGVPAVGAAGAEGSGHGR